MTKFVATFETDHRVPAATIVTRRSVAGDGPLRVALINNMPDAALVGAEQRFADMLCAASGDRPVEFIVCGLPTVERGAVGRAYLESRGVPVASLWHAPPAAIIITGAEPKHRDFRDETYWDSLVDVLDQAEAHAIPCLLSCLAAHAAVQHLSDVRRQSLPDKCFGVFDHVIATTHELGRGAGRRMRLPHSRWNSVAASALIDAGYRIVSHSSEVGAGFFTRRGRSLWLFCQGHPEYDSVNLLREYRRDVLRFLLGERATYPNLPRNYFSAADERALTAFKDEALAVRNKDLIAGFPLVAVPPPATAAERLPVMRVVGNWLAEAARMSDQREASAAMLRGW